MTVTEDQPGPMFRRHNSRGGAFSRSVSKAIPARQQRSFSANGFQMLIYHLYRNLIAFRHKAPGQPDGFVFKAAFEPCPAGAGLIENDFTARFRFTHDA
jgi:hypothetical protein